MNRIKLFFTTAINNFNKKYQISFTDPIGNKLVWKIFISPSKASAALLIIFSLGFIASTILIIYTPFQNIFPYYVGGNSRAILVNSISRIDSLEKELEIWDIYRENITRIINGAAPIATAIDSARLDTTKLTKGEIVSASKEDSIFRNKILAFSVDSSENLPAKNVKQKSTVELFMPVNGVVTKKYDLRENFRGIEFTTTGLEPVLAVNNGKVIISYWTPEQGNVIQIQQGDGLITIYKGLTDIFKVVGDSVQGGEGIGSIGTDSKNKKDTHPLVVEFWLGGNSIDPSNYLNF